MFGGRHVYNAFLFAVLRDVQRNGQRQEWFKAEYGFLFAVLRDVQRNPIPQLPPHEITVSIRCLARRTAERPASLDGFTVPGEFLFAVLRDVQRNVNGCNL